MTPTEYALMTAIWSYWWTNESDPWPSVEHLREQLGKSERQVRRLLQRLRDKGFMLSVEQYNYEHKQVSNRYDFTPFLKRLVDYLEALEQPTKPDKASGEGVRNGRESVSESARSGCQNGQGIEDESDSDPSNRDTSSSSGSAASSKGTVLPPAPTCSHIAHRTIRKTEEETEESREIESRRSSNPPTTSQKLAASGRAKEAKQENTGKKESKWEEFVLASGVPRERLYELETWLQSCPRPGQTPLLVQAIIDPISQQFNNGRLMIANRTQATKLYLYARAQGLQHEELEDAFREWVHTAFKHVHPHVEKKMAWFFRALKVELLKSLMSFASSPAPLPGESPSEEEAAPVTEPGEESASPYHPAGEATITLDDDQGVTTMGEAGEASPLFSREQGNEPEQGSLPVNKHMPTGHNRKAREDYARHMKWRLARMGVSEPTVQFEHRCGCPLYYSPTRWGKPRCASCDGDRGWSQELKDLIESIRTYDAP